MAAIDTTPDWLKNLLPDTGGKVSVTLQGATAPTVAPAAAVSAAPTATTAAAPTPTTQQLAPMAAAAVAPKPTAAAPAPPATKTWFNPYTGKNETIPGMSAAGAITDPNAFWNYYAHYQTPTLQALATKGAAGANAYGKPIDYNPIVPSNPNYQTGLANINLQRYIEALQYGDTSLFGDMGLTAEQKNAIAANPNSTLNQMRRDFLKANYDVSSGLASHGLWSSGARNQGLQNNLLANIRQQQGAQMGIQLKNQQWDQQQRDLFQSVKGDLEKNAKYDPGNVEHNKILQTQANAVVARMASEANTFLKNLLPTNSHSIEDMRKAMHSILDTKRKYNGKIDPKMIAQMDAKYKAYVDRIHYLQKFRAGQAGQSKTVIVNTKPTRVR